MSLRRYMHMSTDTCEGHKRVANSMEFQAVLRHLTWVLWTKLRSSRRANAFTLQAISPAPWSTVFKPYIDFSRYWTSMEWDGNLLIWIFLVCSQRVSSFEHDFPCLLSCHPRLTPAAQWVLCVREGAVLAPTRPLTWLFKSSLTQPKWPQGTFRGFCDKLCLLVSCCFSQGSPERRN